MTINKENTEIALLLNKLILLEISGFCYGTCMRLCIGSRHLRFAKNSNHGHKQY